MFPKITGNDFEFYDYVMLWEARVKRTGAKNAFKICQINVVDVVFFFGGGGVG